MKKDERDAACSMHVTEEFIQNFGSEFWMKWNVWEYLGVDERVILQWVLKKVESCRLDLFGPE
jgi:hypothetical protein